MTAIRNNTSPSASNSEEIQNAQVEALTKWIERNRPVLDVFLDAYVVVDVRNKVVDFNEAFTELCGESYRRILKIGNFCDLLTTEHCPFQCPAKQIITSEKKIRLDEVKAKSKNNPDLHLILSGVPITLDGFGTVGSIITVRNVSAEMELQKKYDERKRDSITDGLTRLFNKVYTESALDRMIRAATRDETPISVVMCDIDHFKKVNDVYGHQAGDHVLAMVGQMLKGETRESDIAGRFGGEEFIVLLFKSDQAGAMVFTERFRKRVESTQFNFSGTIIPVTVSLGTASFKSKWETGMDASLMGDDLVKKADMALYLAKANGRNQTCQYETIKASQDKKKG